MNKTIKIAHLYYDLMNLYGESGNIKALVKFIERQNITPEVHFLTIGDDIDFKKYDFYYIGAGSEDDENLVIADLMKYKDNIKQAVEAGKMFLATGNAMEIFGKSVTLADKSIIECLGTFDYQGIVECDRIVSELYYRFDELPIDEGFNFIGFKNARCNMRNVKGVIFEYGDNIRYKNFFGMNIIGPVLIRNPYFTEYLLKILFKQKKLEYTEIRDTIEFKAYHTFVETFIKNRTDL